MNVDLFVDPKGVTRRHNNIIVILARRVYSLYIELYFIQREDMINAKQKNQTDEDVNEYDLRI